jgi:hypothetical protein
MSNHEYDIIIFFPDDSNEQAEIYSWAMEFCRYLDTMLNKLLGYRPTILLSPDIPAREKLLNKNYYDIISDTSLFLFLVSNKTIQNESYQEHISKTFDYLTEINKDVLNRVFKVELEPTPMQDQNKELQKIYNYEFYEINSLSKKAKTIELTEGAFPIDKFWTRLLDVASDMLNALQITKHMAGAGKSQNYIYLAETSIDQRHNYDNIKRELLHQGYTIFPNSRLPNNAGNVQEIILEYLEKCSASIHIIGNQYGDYVLKSDVSVIELQNKVVNEYAQDQNIKKIVFIPKGNRPIDGKQNLFIERLRKEHNKFAEIIESTPAEFMEIMLESLKKSIQAPTASNNHNLLYIISDTLQDTDIKNKLIEIATTYNFNPVFQDKTANISENLEKHTRNLLLADSVLVFQKNNNKLWLQSQLQDLKKNKRFR